MKKRIPILLGLVLTTICLWMLLTPNETVRALIRRVNNIGYDLQLQAKLLTHDALKDSNVVVVDIDDKSLSAEGHWPWPRKKIAKLIDTLEQQGAIVLAFDIFFSEPQEKIDETIIDVLNQNKALTPDMAKVIKEHSHLFNEDEVFANSLKSKNAVLAITFLPEKLTSNELPPPLMTLTPQQKKELGLFNSSGYISSIAQLTKAAKKGGFINIFSDPGGIIRRVPLVMEYEGKVYASLALQAVSSYLGITPELVTGNYHDREELEGIRLGGQLIPTDSKGQALIPFVGKSYTFPFYSATDALNNNLPEDALLGKLVFIGTSATGLGDLQPTAIENPYPGVEIQATVAHGLFVNNFSYVPAWALGARAIMIIVFGLIGSFTFCFLGPRMLGAIVVLSPPILLSINSWIWETADFVIPMLIPTVLLMSIAILNMLYGYLFETRKREELKSMFGQYVPPDHIDEMLVASDNNFALKGDDRDMSVLFADIRSFTSISEKMTAAELVEMLNTFFTPMTEIIFTHRGTIDKYVGDLIMAFWGAPLKDEDHAKNAMISALEMQKKVKELRPMFDEMGYPTINIGIGVNSGIMSVGDMGSEFRRNYTVLGDNVNLGSRVEGLSKYYGVEIIVTENSKNLYPEGIVYRLLDKVRVKGKEEGVGIYEPICERAEVSEERLQELKKYHAALDKYFAQNWDAALTELQTLKEKEPERKIYNLYIERIGEFKKTPPPANWDGVFTHTSK